MRKLGSFIFLVVLILTSCNSFPKKESNFIALENEKYWKNIARAKQIFVVNNSELQTNNTEMNEYYEYDIHINKTLKGAPKTTIQFKIFMEEENFNYIKSLDKSGEVILFLVNVYDGYGYNNYLADYYIENAIIKHTKKTEEIIRSEIQLQNSIINDKLYKNFQIDKKLYNEVKFCIDNTTNILFEHSSFEKLEEMGEIAVPYIILLLDNFKKLPIKSITLRNKSQNAFEGYRHYSPELVIDALTAILNQITGEDFGSIYNGEVTREERILALNGWRIYLYKLNIRE
jgi:hypothetical protein